MPSSIKRRRRKQNTDQTQVQGENPRPESELDPNAWKALSMGSFLAILVDGGPMDAVIFRTLGDNQFEDGSWSRQMEVVIVPNGHIMDTLKELDCTHINGALLEMMRTGMRR